MATYIVVEIGTCTVIKSIQFFVVAAPADIKIVRGVAIAKMSCAFF